MKLLGTRGFVQTGGFEKVIPGYFRIYSNLTSDNQFNALNIAVEKTMTPVERRSLVTAFQSRHQRLMSWKPHKLRGPSAPSPAVGQSAIDQWVSHWKFHDKISMGSKGLSVSRVRTGRGHAIFQTGKKHHRRLLIGWAGQSQRMMMPVANWLPALSVMEYDLLLFWPQKGEGYRRGVSGFAGSVSDVVSSKFIQQFSNEYSSVSVLGTSAGTLPAVLAAEVFNAQNLVLVGLSDPERSDVISGWGDLRGWEHDWQRGGFTPRVHYLFGGDSDLDKRVTLRAAEILLGEITMVANQGHSPIWAMLRGGQFFEWLSSCLD